MKVRLVKPQTSWLVFSPTDHATYEGTVLFVTVPFDEYAAWINEGKFSDAFQKHLDALAEAVERWEDEGGAGDVR